MDDTLISEFDLTKLYGNTDNDSLVVTNDWVIEEDEEPHPTLLSNFLDAGTGRDEIDAVAFLEGGTNLRPDANNEIEGGSEMTALLQPLPLEISWPIMMHSRPIRFMLDQEMIMLRPPPQLGLGVGPPIGVRPRRHAGF